MLRRGVLLGALALAVVGGALVVVPAFGASRSAARSARSAARRGRVRGPAALRARAHVPPPGVHARAHVLVSRAQPGPVPPPPAQAAARGRSCFVGSQSAGPPICGGTPCTVFIGGASAAAANVADRAELLARRSAPAATSRCPRGGDAPPAQAVPRGPGPPRAEVVPRHPRRLPRLPSDAGSLEHRANALARWLSRSMRPTSMRPTRMRSTR